MECQKYTLFRSESPNFPRRCLALADSPYSGAEIIMAHRSAKFYIWVVMGRRIRFIFVSKESAFNYVKASVSGKFIELYNQIK